MARKIEVPSIPSGAHIGVARLRRWIADAEADKPGAVVRLGLALPVKGSAQTIIAVAKRVLANVANW